MKRALLVLTAALGAIGLLRLRCYLRGQHAPVRHFLGAFRCSACGTPGTDLAQMGMIDGGGYVDPLRRGMVRGEFERTAR